ncbi:hypothetical protein D7Z26_00505 [Cohnella endophytica]|uniref:SbsC C-terminal domain-containing protein n=1 Tax=Cohnella endophytica TaxID=2419778 RepID=A0A494Y5Q7_9BACL|nr:hypothetical protein [Cohnella endophytica]RKP58027.1 hypothetical protein D7Z26_00505 [Cohnella endophytica]
MIRKSRKSKTMTIAAIAALTFSLQAMTVSAASSPTPNSIQLAAADSKSSAKVVAEFEALLKKQGQLPRAFAYLRAHIGDVTPSQATVMALHLENAVKAQLPALQKRFEKNSVQQAINRAYTKGATLDQVIARTKDANLKALLKEAKDSGYKLETAEGFYFPIVDYSAFKAFESRVNADIKAYIEIMAVESDQANVKDAGIVIGYQQLVNRALSQESFLAKYPYSNRKAQIANLFNSYRTLTFYGANNTPLFDYEHKAMQPNARKAYEAILSWNKPDSSAYLTTLRKFMDIVEQNGYKLTPAVDQFRKANIPVA